MRSSRTLRVLSVGALGMLPLAAGAQEMTERELAPNVVERVYPDGRRTLLVAGTKLPDRTPAPEPAPEHLVAADRERGFVVYSRAGSDAVFRHSAPRPGELSDTLSTVLTPGETRHVQFAVYSLRSLAGVTVSAPPLRNGGGQSLPDGVLTIHPVRLRYQ